MSEITSPFSIPCRPGYCLFLTVAAVSVLSIGCQQKSETPTTAEPPPLPTISEETFPVEMRTWPTLIRTQGSLIADEVVVVGTRVEGLVDQVHVDLGDRVAAGQPLVTLRQEQFRLELERAAAQLQQVRSAIGLKAEDSLDAVNPENSPPVRERRAEWQDGLAELKRGKGLLAGNAITDADILKLETAVDVARARYDSSLNAVREKIALVKVHTAELGLARQNLDDTIIRAQFDGDIQQKQVAPGRYVRVGDALITVVRSNPLRFRGHIPERYALALNAGQSLQLSVQMVAAPIEATISRISPSVDMLSRGLLFEAVVENNDSTLKSGLFAEAEIVIDTEATAIVIPQSALVEFAGTEKVWKVVDGKCTEQVVLAGERRDSEIEILQGLKPSDAILKDGSKGRVAMLKSKSSE
ncbi:MAG: efflux RND transporter periplasmic adaptor subunit [Planctomycetaceae bacterium]|nr:efflux RND transporter periplasmic adaptor subunit [Planctomycetaceae bacterium]